jgi:hypothetical protein
MPAGKECRNHAVVCSRLADSLPEGRSRQMFADLAKTWLNLATVVENFQAHGDPWSEDSEPPFRIPNC